jgi:hypothetical protein
LILRRVAYVSQDILSVRDGSHERGFNVGPENTLGVLDGPAFAILRGLSGTAHGVVGQSRLEAELARRGGREESAGVLRRKM